MAKLIEARAVITGEEKLSPLLDKLAAKFKQVQQTAKTAEGVDKMAAAIGKVKDQLSAIEKFNAAKIGFRTAADNFKQTGAAVEAAARAMKTNAGDAAKLEREYQRAQRAVQAASRVFETQKTAFAGARAALAGFGIPLDQVTARQNRLAEAVNKANAALERQGKAQRRAMLPGGTPQFLTNAAAGYVSAHGVARGISKSVGAGAHLQHERVALQNAGRSPAEMAAIEAASLATSRVVPTATYTENMKVIAETTGAFGTVEHAIENLPFMQKTASVLHAAAGDKVKDSAGEMGNKFARFFEMRGTAIDSEKFKHEAELMVRAMAFSRGTFNPSEMLNFGQQATPGTLANYNERFLSKIAPSLVTEFGGDRAGTAANAFRSVIMGKARDAKQTEAWIKAGLLDPKMVSGKGSRPESWKAGAVKGTDLALTDPLQWAETVLLPALKKQGIDTDNPLELTKSLNTMFRNSMSNRFIEALTQNRSRMRLHKDEENINKAGSLDEIYQRNISEDPTVAIKSITASLENIAAVATSPGMKAAAGFLSSFAGGLQMLAEAGAKHPNIAMGVGATAGAGALAGAGFLTYSLFNGFGLGASAVALDGAAAALTGAAAALGGGKVAEAGAAAATASRWGRALPIFGVAGAAIGGAWGAYSYWDQTYGNADKTRNQVLNEQRGGTMGDTYRRAFNEDRERLGLPALGRGEETKVEAELKGSAKVTGEAKITIDIPGLGLRSAMVPLQGMLGANGPGSTGASSPDAAAPGSK